MNLQSVTHSFYEKLHSLARVNAFNYQRRTKSSPSNTLHKKQFDQCLESVLNDEFQFGSPSSMGVPTSMSVGNKVTYLYREKDNSGVYRLETPWQVSLSPIADTHNLYVKLDPYKLATNQTPGLSIPGKGFTYSSYNWSRIYNICDLEIMINTLSIFGINDVNEYLDFIIGSSNESESYPCRNIDISLLGSAHPGDPGASYRDILSEANLRNLLHDPQKLRIAMNSRGLELIALKPLGTKSTDKINHNSKTTSPLISNNIVRNWILFADSLDLSPLLSDSNLRNDLKSLSQFISSSCWYKNLTSSGSWTFPCLHSMHTGLDPRITLSARRWNPNLAIRDRDKLLPPRNMLEKRGIDVNQRIRLGRLRGSFLTSLLKEHGYTSVGLKSSNHGWYYSLNHSIDLTIENTDCLTNTSKDVEYLLKSFGDHHVDTIFIDLEHFHYTVPTNSLAGTSCQDLADLLLKDVSKDERLLGTSKEPKKARDRYIEQLRTFDKALGEIMDKVGEKDNIILFSDHGSQTEGYQGIRRFDFRPNSPLTLEKVWKPTLLIKSNNLKEGLQYGGSSSELVTHNDLYAIILGMHNIDHSCNAFSSSNLPTSLGGHHERKYAITSSFTHFGRDNNHVEMLLRYGDDSGEYFSMPTDSIPSCGSHQDSKITGPFESVIDGLA